jgi:Ca2+-binding RTX toxin-like protein
MSHPDTRYQAGTEGRDILYGTEGGDHIDALGGSDDVYLGGGADFAFGGAGGDRLFGGDGDDVLNGGADSDRLDGGSGFNSADYHDAAGAVSVDLTTTGAQNTRSSGYDRLINIQRVVGSRFDDFLRGNSLDNILNGKEGDDFLRGEGGDDILNGSLGVDTVGFDHGDSVTVDLALGQATGQGIDTLLFVENVVGSSDADRLSGSRAANILNGWLGDDRLYGRDGDDFLFGGIGNGIDYLNGGEGADRLEGGSGGDRLFGLSGSDILRGDFGRDRLQGGDQRDILFGGRDRDTFIFDDGDTGATLSRADVIKDFEYSDKINLGLIDAKEGGDDDQFTFIGTSAFTGAPGELRCEDFKGNTYIQGDTDGDQVADFLIRLDGTHHVLNAADFVL